MKKMFRVLTAMAVVGAMAVPARAGTASEDLEVSAVVEANCTITTETLDFGSYDPVYAHRSTSLTGTGSVKVICTLGAPVTIGLGQGSNADDGSTDGSPARRMTNGSAFLSYDLFSDAGLVSPWGNTTEADVESTGTGDEVTLTVYGEIPAGQNVPTGNYTDTVVATVTF